jgi:hypothetical protein
MVDQRELVHVSSAREPLDKRAQESRRHREDGATHW